MSVTSSWRHPKVNSNLDQWYEKATIEPLEGLGGAEFHPEAEPTIGLLIRVKDRPAADRPCMVYFHGGACTIVSERRCARNSGARADPIRGPVRYDSDIF